LLARALLILGSLLKEATLNRFTLNRMILSQNRKYTFADHALAQRKSAGDFSPALFRRHKKNLRTPS
jgi:hypothetical protein